MDMDDNEDRTAETLPSPLDILMGRIRRELQHRQPERAIDVILNAPPECYEQEPPKSRTVPAVTADEVRQAIRSFPHTTNKEIAAVLGCHVKTVILQRRLVQKQRELRPANRSGSR